MFVASCGLMTVICCWSLFVVGCLLAGLCSLHFVVCLLLIDVCCVWWWIVVCCPLFVDWCLRCVVVCCMLCLWFAVHCFGVCSLLLID